MSVYLVGAGPGDPSLLTVRAAELLGRADVVVFDRLVDPRILELTAPGAQLIDVGKGAGEDGESQETINALLVEHGQKASIVVRLKGGDPYVFGRGAEEALALEDAGVTYEVVPGLSSLAAVPSYAGVPLTARGVSSRVIVVTGHDPTTWDTGNSLGWSSADRSTLVILMGVAKRGEIAARLIGDGWSPTTPVLVVEAGTTPRQRSLRMGLEELASAQVVSPATIVVGEVAAMKLASLEDRPLFSWRVVITRSSSQSLPLSRALSDLGAETIAFPTIGIEVPSDDGRALFEVSGRIAEFSWVVFSSTNAVDALSAALEHGANLSGVKLAAIGSETAAALSRRGLRVDLVASSYGTEALLSDFPPPKDGGSVLLPRSSLAGDRLPMALSELGWNVESVEAYRTVPKKPDLNAAKQLAGADVVTFTSSSTVTGFLQGAGKELLAPVVVSIGPATSATLRAAGIEPTVEASTHTTSGMIDALVQYALAGGHRDQTATRRRLEP